MLRFDADVLELFIRKVYGGMDTANEIEAGMWREVLRIINAATVEGLASATTPPPTREQWFYHELRHGNEVFAAFKVHAMGQEMAAKLLDADGRLKPFAQWRREVEGIASHQMGSWLRTEYDTAVIRAHQAADWMEFERNKDIFPNLRWMPTTSPEPETTHAAYWQAKLTLPVDDPFWMEHHPGDRWNCKCSLEATDEPVNRPADLVPVKPQRGLDSNPGKDGHIFNDTHPYYPKDCAHCFAYKKGGFKNRLSALFVNREKDCNNCPFIDGCIRRETLTQVERTRRLNSSECSEIIANINQWADRHLDVVQTSSGVEKFKMVTVSESGTLLKINKKFFNETFAKNIHNRRLAETMDLALHFEEWMPQATIASPPEVGRHHACSFFVYRATHNGTNIMFKVKDNGNGNVYTMRIIQ